MNRFVIYIYTLSKQGFFSLLHQGNIVHKLQAACEQHANLLVTLQQQARHIARTLARKRSLKTLCCRYSLLLGNTAASWLNIATEKDMFLM